MYCLLDGDQSGVTDISVGDTASYIVEHVNWYLLSLGSGEL